MRTAVLAAGVLAMGTLAVAVDVPRYIARSDYLFQVGTAAVASGDVNGDGRIDILSADTGGGISVGLNQGAGRFEFAAPYRLVYNSTTSALAVGDLNGDGVLDVVVGPQGAFYYALGNNDGTFGPPQVIPFGNPSTSPSVFVVADVNGDGRQDIATATRTGLALTLNNGNGQFTTPAEFTFDQCTRVAAADLNDDHNMDIVASCQDGLAVVLGHGNSFELLPELPIAQGASALAVGDVNGDGRPDAVVTYGLASGIQTFFGVGDGTFSAGPPASVSVQFGDMKLTDLDVDARLDLVIANGRGYVLLLKGKGDGSFEAPISWPVAPGNNSLVVDHFRDSSHFDIASANTGSYTVSALLQQQQPFQYNEGIGFNTYYASSAVMKADFNGDGRPDVALAGPRFVQIFWGIGKTVAGVTSGPVIPFAQPLIAAAAGDFNADGKPDLAVLASSTRLATILLGQGGGQFQVAARFQFAPYGPLKAGDFNGDGKQDLVSAGGLVVYGRGDGTFSSAVQFAPSPYTGLGPPLAVADFNGDGVDDVALGSPSSVGDSVSISFGSKSGGLSAPFLLPIDNYGVYTYGVSDVNNDGVADLLVAGNLGDLSVLLGDGTGRFNELPRVKTNFGHVSQIEPGDFNHDGKADFFVSLPDNTCVDLYLGNGDGTFVDGGAYGAGYVPTYLTAGHFQAAVQADTLIVGDNGGTLRLLNLVPTQPVSTDDFPPIH